MKERNLKLDNAKGILITLVVIGHMLLPIQGTTRGVTNFFYMIYAFHMPAFVFISGLLAQRIYTRVPKPAQAPTGNRAKRRQHRAANAAGGRQMASRAAAQPTTSGGVSGAAVATEGHFNGRRWCSTLWLYLLFQFILFFSEIPAYGRTTRFPDFLHTSGAPWYLLALLLWYLMIPFFFAGYFIGPERLMRFLGAEQERALSKNQTGRKDILASKDAERAAALTSADDRHAVPEATSKRASSRRRSPEEDSKRAGRGIVLLLTALGLLCFLLVGTQTFDRLLPYKNVVYGAWYYRFHPEQNPAAFPGDLAACLWLIRLVWFLVSGLMSFTLLALMPNRRLPLVTTIGQRTLQIYILHRPIRDLLLAGGFITAAGPENSAHVLLLIVLSILLTIVLSAGILQRLFDAIQKLPERLLL